MASIYLGVALASSGPSSVWLLAGGVLGGVVTMSAPSGLGLEWATPGGHGLDLGAHLAAGRNCLARCIWVARQSEVKPLPSWNEGWRLLSSVHSELGAAARSVVMESRMLTELAWHALGCSSTCGALVAVMAHAMPCRLIAMLITTHRRLVWRWVCTWFASIAAHAFVCSVFGV